MKLSDLGDLIDAAGARDSAATTVIDRVGPAPVAEALITELVERAELDGLPDRATDVRFELTFRGKTVPRVVRASAEDVTHRGESGDRPDVTVTQDLLDLLRGVYGPSAVRTNPTRVITWHDQTPISGASEVPRAAPVVRRLLRGSADEALDLTDLLLRAGSDKWGLHFYTEHYERYFRPFRDRPIVLLELGIGGFDDPAVGGGSLRAWSRYFHRGIVCGVDISSKTGVERQRVVALRGDQADAALLTSFVEQFGAPDIVVDDGSHRSEDVIASFGVLFPALRPGGLYVVEDLQTSYWPRFGGSSTDLTDPATSTGFLKTLVDGLNHEEISPSSGRLPAITDTQVAGVHFHHNLAVVEKGSNEEGSLPAWHPARAD